MRPSKATVRPHAANIRAPRGPRIGSPWPHVRPVSSSRSSIPRSRRRGKKPSCVGLVRKSSTRATWRGSGRCGSPRGIRTSAPCTNTSARPESGPVSVATQHFGDLRGWGLRPTTGKRVDSAIDAAVAKSAGHKPPETIGEIADQMCGNRFDIPTNTQARGGQLVGVKAVNQRGDGPPLSNRCEYPFRFDRVEPHTCRISGRTSKSVQAGSGAGRYTPGVCAPTGAVHSPDRQRRAMKLGASSDNGEKIRR